MTAPIDVRTTRESLGCAWCGEPVHTPQKGWALGQAVYCPAHAILTNRHPIVVGLEAIDQAEWLHEMPLEQLMRWPWASLHEFAGALVPGRVTYVCAFPGGGKTTFLTQCLASWVAQGFCVSYLPLESDLGEVYTRMACYQLGLNADEALSLRLRERAQLMGDPQAAEDVARLSALYRALRTERAYMERFCVEPIDALSPQSFQRAISAARALEADILVVDHVDHVEGEADDYSPEIKLSNQLQTLALRAAKSLGIPVVLASQLNSSRTGGDHLAHYRPPLADWMFNKGKKEQIGAQILGLYRPQDPHADNEIVRRVRAGAAEPWRIALPNRMGINGMKMRFGGANKGRTLHLDFTDGLLSDLPDDARRDTQAMAHGIRTADSPSMFGGGR